MEHSVLKVAAVLPVKSSDCDTFIAVGEISGSKHLPVIPIVGGAIGGVLVIVLVLVLIIIIVVAVKYKTRHEIKSDALGE